ncbi:hypothetical protein BW731_02180 [Vagococcus martis]|uniref:Uncharacterized protein n=1 Tax=Vagococcus martis TaxID=1768210 RepID=A0A1V4DF52_9ENTE|nr:hypothetical protein BW731_02180 [Vagococcus martis]
MILFCNPVKNKEGLIIIGYPVFTKKYSKFEHNFKISLTKIYKRGHFRTKNGVVRFNHAPLSTPFMPYKVIIYVYRIEKNNNSTLVGSHIIDAGYRRKKAQNKYKKIKEVILN